MNKNSKIFKTREGTLDLSASVTRVGEDVVVIIWGGEKPHIGAVALAQPRKSLKDAEKTSATASVLSIVGHKEDAVVKAVSERLAAAVGSPVAVTAGMHWESLQAKDIRQVLKNVESLTAMVEKYLRSLSAGDS